jgi:NTE family protein
MVDTPNAPVQEAPTSAKASRSTSRKKTDEEHHGRFHEKRLWKPKGKKVVNLALQGGGAHGAFTWGVCDRLLEDPTFEIEGITGTSAGAMNATVLAYGFAKNGQAGARAALDEFWHAIADAARFSPFKRTLMDRIQGSWSLDNSPGYHMMDLIGRMFSPYDLNPTGNNPLREVLEAHVDFEFLRKHSEIKVFLNAVNVRTGKLRQFRNEDLSASAVLASGCLPFMFHAVEIDGEHYWDGGYCGNPALYPLIYYCTSPDILLVQINPLYREELPRSARQILDRVNEISFNSSLMREMRAIKFVSDLIDQGKLSEEDYVKLHIHMISNDELAHFGASSKLNAELDFLLTLKELGRNSADEWLNKHWDMVNVQSTCDLQVFM